MEYNTTRSRLLMPEYGRNVQKMIEYLVTVEDRAKRLRNAEVIIELMGTLNPHLKTIEDYKHKLWDHLYQMTNFSLDVDAPYPRPTAEEIYKKPECIPYPQASVKHRHLGKNLQALLDKAMAETNDEKRHGLTQAIGYYMKLAYANWHKEPVHDDMIKSELNVISGGKLRFEGGGGYRVPQDNQQRPSNAGGGGAPRGEGFKQQRNTGSSQTNSTNTNSRNFKNNQGGTASAGTPRNTNFRDNASGAGAAGGFNKNRKFKKK